MTKQSKVILPDSLLDELKDAFQKLSHGYGSIEIIVQDKTVKQINTREIIKLHCPITE